MHECFIILIHDRMGSSQLFLQHGCGRVKDAKRPVGISHLVTTNELKLFDKILGNARSPKNIHLNQSQYVTNLSNFSKQVCPIDPCLKFSTRHDRLFLDQHVSPEGGHHELVKQVMTGTVQVKHTIPQ